MAEERSKKAQSHDSNVIMKHIYIYLNQGRAERVPLVATYHPALNSLGKVARRLHPMLTNSEEHREVFPEPPFDNI